MSANEKSLGSGPGRVSEIDLLRFVAAVCVVLFHYAFRGHAANGYSDLPYPELAPLARYGYLGVELFFLISGFVILMTASSGSLRKFAISRIVRLYPAYWVCCTVTFLSILALGNGRFDAGFRQYLANLTMLNEFVGIPSIDGVYWSLAVELTFYAMVAAVLLLRQLPRIELFLAAWLILALAMDLHSIDRLRQWFITDSAPFFVGGAACFLIHARGASFRGLALFSAAWLIGMAHAVAPLSKLGRIYGGEFSATAVATIVTVFFALMLLVALRRTGAVGRRNWMAVGALTYPLYLLHQYIGYMLFNQGYPHLNRHVLFWGTFALMLIGAFAVNRLIEQRYSATFKKFLERHLPGTTSLDLRPVNR
jgi:peptidoglycan/LPS O-acetylase OafA/YrhL